MFSKLKEVWRTLTTPVDDLKVVAGLDKDKRPDNPYGGVRLTSDEIQQLKDRAKKEGWAHQDIVIFDVFVNSLAFHWLKDYTPFQTMSSHFQLAADEGNKFAQAMTWALQLIQERHGQKAEVGDVARDEQSEQIEKPPLGLK